jgi:hypothetical protein
VLAMKFWRDHLRPLGFHLRIIRPHLTRLVGTLIIGATAPLLLNARDFATIIHFNRRWSAVSLPHRATCQERWRCWVQELFAAGAARRDWNKASLEGLR